MVVEIPLQTAASLDGRRNTSPSDGKEGTRWKTVGKVNSERELSNGAIEVPLRGIPSRGARIYRLWNMDRRHHTYVTTGSFIFE
mmetsp:Transcript_6231/g.8686  ORF Transcript_6231/g.8686 Transcript_6231/m.8686 type:complete len:84 (+) Transcript_6231:164-415(+)